MRTAYEQGSSSFLKPPKMFFSVKNFGEGTRQALFSGNCWRVFAIFRHSFYIQSTNGDLVCLGPQSIGAGPLNALYRFPLEINWLDNALKEDAVVTFDGRLLQIADRFVFNLFGAQRWRPPAICNYRRPEALNSGLALIKKFAPCHAPQDSLGYLISGLIGNPEMEKPQPAAITAFQQACLNGAAYLKTWLVERLKGQVDRMPPAEIKSLLGLGPGLTPSGDDMLGGSLIAMHSLKLGGIAHELWDWLRPAAKQRTNKISFAHLKWAARGSGSAPIHLLIRALFSNNTAELPDCLRALGRIGHTSGWDALAGIALVCNSYLENRPPCSGSTIKISGDERCR